MISTGRANAIDQLDSVYLNDASYEAFKHDYLVDTEHFTPAKAHKGPKITIVGGGPTGLSAAILAYQAGASVFLIEKIIYNLFIVFIPFSSPK